MLTDYGGRLIFAGEIDCGMDILRSTVGFGAILPSWTHFYLFLGHYHARGISPRRAITPAK